MGKEGPELKPTFKLEQFHFEDPLLVPDHYDEWPSVPNFVGLWSLYGWSSSRHTPAFAVDVISAEQAELLAMAKRERMESELAVYGYSLDIYILDPSGNSRRFYTGRSQD